MGTAIGDLVVSLGIQNQQFVSALNTSGAKLDEFAGHTEQATKETEHFNGQIEGLRGGARGLDELGRGAQELSEKFGGAGTAAGSLASGIGNITSGVGEAGMMYHALQESIELASGAQMFLNSISPLGWAAIATGAIAATAAYLHFSSASDEAAESAKRLAEAQKAAGKETDSAIAELQKEADKLNKTPLRQFQEELANTGKSATAIAEATEKFKLLQNQIAAGKHNEMSKKIDADLARKSTELNQEGWTSGMKFLAGVSPQASDAQRDHARELSLREDDAKIQDKANRDEETDRQRAVAQARSLVESAKSPLDRLIDSEKNLMSDFQRGLIDRGQYETGLHALGERTEAMIPKEKEKKEEPLGALEMNSAAAFEEIFKMQHPDGMEDNAKETAANTAKANALLQELVFKMDQSAFAIR